jgi:G3E family GTPase
MIQSFILTGFLGVGKTTMLIHTVKEHFKEKNVAIIVNEFGDVGVDGNLVRNVHSEVLEISQGCICCQLNRELEEGVKEIIDKYEPEVLFVETSGASEPSPIFQSLQTLPLNKQFDGIPTFLAMQNHGISVEGVICVIDAKNFDSYKENSTAKAQVGGANIIVLNKIDLVTDEELEAIKQELVLYKEEHNIINRITKKPVFNNYLIQTAVKGVVKKELFDGLYKLDEVIKIASEDHHNHTAKDAITQKVAYIKEHTEFEQIKQLLKALPKSIYRVKGIVKTADIDDPVVINYAFGDASFHEDAEHQGKRSVMIFIGESIEEDITALSEQFLFLNLPRFKVTR